MSNVGTLLSRIPDEAKPWAALGLGSFVLVCLVLFHGFGIHWVLTLHNRGERRLRKGRPHLVSAVLLFGISIFLLLSLHLTEIVVWAFSLMRLGLIERAHDAIYFCANAYTTLGYGTVDLDVKWRNISPVIGLSGLFTFAWTTSALVSVVAAHNRLLELLHDEREKQLALRVALRKAIWETRAREKDAERATREATEHKIANATMRERWDVWREENRQVMALRKGALKEVAGLYQEEQAAEESLGPGEEEKP